MPSKRVRKTRCPQCRGLFTPTAPGDPSEVCDLCENQLILPFPPVAPVRDARGRFVPAGGAR
ncbi:hypothetical protein GCM10010124_33740 [Pilimelia terevasa]|uniref:Uncharacterized protein n=1 Tax=Pilimelia terevasa TaxID=53372 RepID=A0A8J3BTF3_9ACTN|nr:hypothetical protein GCM10010124_33740 [Pilimelia terevasa]